MLANGIKLRPRQHTASFRSWQAAANARGLMLGAATMSGAQASPHELDASLVRTIEAIHASKTRAVIYATGGAVQVGVEEATRLKAACL